MSAITKWGSASTPAAGARRSVIAIIAAWGLRIAANNSVVDFRRMSRSTLANIRTAVNQGDRLLASDRFYSRNFAARLDLGPAAPN